MDPAHVVGIQSNENQEQKLPEVIERHESESVLKCVVCMYMYIVYCTWSGCKKTKEHFYIDN